MAGLTARRAGSLLAGALLWSSPSLADGDEQRALTLGADGRLSRGSTLVGHGSRVQREYLGAVLCMDFIYMSRSGGLSIGLNIGFGHGSEPSSSSSSSTLTGFDAGGLAVSGLWPLVWTRRFWLAIEAGAGLDIGNRFTPGTLVRFAPNVGLTMQARLGEEVWLLGSVRPAPVALMARPGDGREEAPDVMREWPAELLLSARGFGLGLRASHVTLIGGHAERVASQNELGLFLGYRGVFVR